MTDFTRLPTPSWRKSSYSDSNGGECLEVADDHPTRIHVRDSKSPGPNLAVPLSAWSAFVAHIAR